jgi:hypothetical protein
MVVIALGLAALMQAQAEENGGSANYMLPLCPQIVLQVGVASFAAASDSMEQ